MATPTRITIAQSPHACATGFNPLLYLSLQLPLGIELDPLAAGGPIDAPENLPMGGAWNYQTRDEHISITFGSVSRQGVLE